MNGRAKRTFNSVSVERTPNKSNTRSERDYASEASNKASEASATNQSINQQAKHITPNKQNKQTKHKQTASTKTTTILQQDYTKTILKPNTKRFSNKKKEGKNPLNLIT